MATKLDLADAQFVGWGTCKAEFTLNVMNDTITTETIKQIIEYAGDYVGIGSFRPTNNGMYGRFAVKEFIVT